MDDPIDLARAHLRIARPTDDLAVFYLPDEGAWRTAVARLERAGHRPVRSFNPYWDKRGRTFEDPDGYRVVLQNESWMPDLATTTTRP